jgi:hypothetical protein
MERVKQPQDEAGWRFFLVQELVGSSGLVVERGEVVELTGLMAMLAEMRNAWRAGRGTYDVRTMCAFGAVITEVEGVMDFAEGTGDGNER